MHKFIEIKKDKFENYPESSILRAEDYAIILKAEDIIERANKKARDIVSQAQEDAHGIAEEARDKAVATVMKNTSTTILNTLNICNKFLANSSIFLHKAVVESVKKILSGYSSQEVTLKMIEAALHKHRCSKVLLKVNPKSLDYISRKTSELKMSFPTILEIKITQSDDVHETGCILETDIGNIQATLDSHLQALEDTYILPINPAIVKAVVEQDPDKLEEAKDFLAQAETAYKQKQESEEFTQELDQGHQSESFTDKQTSVEKEYVHSEANIEPKADRFATEEDIPSEPAAALEEDSTASPEASAEAVAGSSTAVEDIPPEPAAALEEDSTTSPEASAEAVAGSSTAVEDIPPEPAAALEEDSTTSPEASAEAVADRSTTEEDIPPEPAAALEEDNTASPEASAEAVADSSTTEEAIPPEPAATLEEDTASPEASAKAVADSSTAVADIPPELAAPLEEDNTVSPEASAEAVADSSTTEEDIPPEPATEPEDNNTASPEVDNTNTKE